MDKIFLDTETTGLDPYRHSTWEIAYAVNDGPVYFSVVPHTLDRADPEALYLNDYFARINPWPELQEQVAFEKSFKESLRGNIVVGANPAFDASFLHARYGEQLWHYRLIDLEAYAMPALGLSEPRGLAFIAEQLGIDTPDHSAAQDVYVLRKCYEALEKIYGHTTF